MENVTFDIIGLACLGRDFNLVRGSEAELARDYRDVTGPHMLLYFVLSACFSFSFVQSLPWTKNKVFNDSTRSMRRVCQQFVQEKKELLATSAGAQVDILSRLLVTDHDTTSATLTWIFYLLAKYPEWQTNIRDEVAKVDLPLAGGSSVETTLEGLAILNGVNNETLRLSCIGKDFAKAELRCILATLAKAFEWRLDMEEKHVVAAGAITIKPQNGLFLKKKPVNAAS
ncbi:P450 monooxygenase [Apiospora marii]|uniref:P450 monooxygenase n=1 Tax=Apiospora marii TaxID=335849 RepID=A0ABR1T0Y2_9PEZI